MTINPVRLTHNSFTEIGSLRVPGGDVHQAFHNNPYAFAVSPAIQKTIFNSAKSELHLHLNLKTYNLDVCKQLALHIANRCYDDDNVRNLEFRIPAIHPHLELKAMIRTICWELKDRGYTMPGLKTSIIVCADKSLSPEKLKEIVDCIIALREDPMPGDQLIGLDISGPDVFTGPEGSPVKFMHEKFKRIVEQARAQGVKIMAHSGEKYFTLEDGLDAISQSVKVLGARRIGHASALLIDPSSLKGEKDGLGEVYDPMRIKSLFQRQHEVARLLIEKDVLLEACPVDDLEGQLDAPGGLKDHPIKKWMWDGLKVTLCCNTLDKPEHSLTSVYLRAAYAFGFSEYEVTQLIDQGLEG